MTTSRYLSRADWGGEWDGSPRPERLPDAECYIHHVGGAAWMDGDAAAIFRELNEYAINVKGYQFLDYDLLVHYDRTRDILTIGEGRGEFMSAATRNRNEEGEAIVLCGNTHLRRPLAIEMEGLARAYVIGIEHDWITRDAQILGHRDNLAYPDGQPTACPGQYLYAQLGDVIYRAARLLTPTPAEENDMLYLARNANNQYELRRGDGDRASILRSREYARLRDLMLAGRGPRYHNRETGQPIASWDAIPELGETDLDLYIGYPDPGALADEG